MGRSQVIPTAPEIGINNLTSGAFPDKLPQIARYVCADDAAGGHEWMLLFIHEIEILHQMSCPSIVSRAAYSMPTELHPARITTSIGHGCSLLDVKSELVDWDSEIDCSC
jgi:hypothetical protein